MNFVCEHLEPRQLLAATLGDDFVPVSGLGHAIEARADINGDGVLDVLGRTGAFTDRRWVLSIGRADGSFVAGSELPVIGRARTGRDARVAEVVIAGRFTGDEHVDLLVVRKRVMGAGVRVRLLVGDSTGSFTAGPQSMLALRFDTGALAAQFDGLAGRATLVSTQIDEVVGVTFADTLRPAQPVVLVSHRGAALLAVADADDDGREDLLVREPDVVTGSPVSVAIYQSVGSAGMPVLARHAVATTDAYPVLADMDEDGLLDLVFTSGFDVVSSRNLGLGLDLPGFGAPTVLFTLSPSRYDADDSGVIAAGDSNGDGRADVLVERTRYVFNRIPYYESSVSIFSSNEDGTYTDRFVGSTTDYYSQIFYRGMDFGGDGLLDVYDGQRQKVLRSISDDVRVPATVGAFAVTAHDPLTAQRTLIAKDVTDDTGVLLVNFYRDSDGDGVWTPADEYLGRDLTATEAGEFNKQLRGDYAFGGSGPKRFFARAFDTFGFFGPAISADIVFEGPTEIVPIESTPFGDATLSGAPTTTSNARRLPLAVADFTGDDRPDLLVYTIEGSRVTGVFMRRGLPPSAAAPDAPRYGIARRVLSAADARGLYTTQTIVGAFTSGSALDVMLVRRKSDYVQEVLLLKNDGTGNMTLMPVALAVDFFGGLSVAALDGPSARRSLLVVDGRKDELRAIKFTDAGGIASSRLLAAGDDMELYTSGSAVPPIRAADFDGDGREDVLVTRSYTGGVTLQLVLSRGGGRFESQLVATTSAGIVKSVTIGDVDGDGAPDIVVGAWNYGAFGGGYVWTAVYRTERVEGGVQFGEAREIHRINVDAPREIEFDLSILGIGDLTGDGRPDVAIEVWTYDFDELRLAAIVVENPWSDIDMPEARVLLFADQPGLDYYQIGRVFLVADADGDGVLDLFRRDLALEIWRMV